MSESRSTASPGFPETRWTLVLSSRGSDTHSRRALGELCHAYWYPLYAHARSRGCTAADAEDLTQTLFGQMLARESIHRLSPDAGRLRSYFLCAMDNLIRQDHRHRTAGKRGGGAVMIPIDHAAAEQRLAEELKDISDPLRLFNRRWAVTLLDQVMDRLQQEYDRQGNGDLFNRLAPFAAGAGTGSDARVRYRECAIAAGITEGHFRVLVFRFRGRYRQLLRDEIAETVESPDLIDAEIADLFAAVSGRR